MRRKLTDFIISWEKCTNKKGYVLSLGGTRTVSHWIHGSFFDNKLITAGVAKWEFYVMKCLQLDADVKMEHAVDSFNANKTVKNGLVS